MTEVNSSYITYLIDLSKSGRKNSFMELCKLHVGSIYPLILRINSDLLVAREIAVDVFISAWENLNHHRADTPFSDWLKGIAVYMCMEETRTHARKKRIEKLQQSSAENEKTLSPQSNNRLEKLVFDLPELQRVVFVLHDMEGYSCQEISDFLGESSCDKIKDELKKTRRELMSRMKS